jgi:hypothetical protein
MATHTITIKLPPLLETIMFAPLLLCRLLRYGYTFRLIPLTRGMYTIVDVKDYEQLRKLNWQVQSGVQTYYATSTIFINGKPKRIWMHRYLMLPKLDTEFGARCSKAGNPFKGIIIDHINGDGLDNRRANLRICTYSQNICNTRIKIKGASKYRGVSKSGKSDKPWQAKIYIHRKQIVIGFYETEIEAALAYDSAARKYHGLFATLNFPAKKPKLNIWQRIRKLRKLPAAKDLDIQTRIRFTTKTTKPTKKDK